MPNYECRLHDDDEDIHRREVLCEACANHAQFDQRLRVEYKNQTSRKCDRCGAFGTTDDSDSDSEFSIDEYMEEQARLRVAELLIPSKPLSEIAGEGPMTLGQAILKVREYVNQNNLLDASNHTIHFDQTLKQALGVNQCHIVGLSIVVRKQMRKPPR